MLRKFLFLLFIFSLFIPQVFADTYVRGYTRSDGTYVNGYYRSSPNYTKLDNFSTKGNYNPYTGQKGYIDPYRNSQSYNNNYSGSFNSNNFRYQY